MNRIGHFFRVFWRRSQWVPVIRLDLGSFFSKVTIDDGSPAMIESCFLKMKASGQVVGVGGNSLDYFERKSDQLEIIFPFAGGRVADRFQTSLFLKTIFDNYLASAKKVAWQPTLARVKLSVSPLYSSVQKQALEQILTELGAVEVEMIPQAQAIYWSQMGAGEQLSPKLVVDIGADSTLVAVVNRTQVLEQEVLELGAKDFNQLVRRVIKAKYGCEVGYKTAEKIYRSILVIPDLQADVTQSQNNLQMAVRGKDILKSLPKTVTVASSDFSDAAHDLAQEMTTQILEVMAALSFDDLQTVVESGLYLTGGGSQLAGLDKFIESQVKIRLEKSLNPFFDVITGLNYDYHSV